MAAWTVALLFGACNEESALQFEPGPALGAPQVAGPARYEDRNRNGACDAGDILIVPFGTQVALSGSSVSAAEIFALPDWTELCDIANPDSFGTGATLEPGPGATEITITLGDGASLKTRQIYDGTCSGDYPPTGIDLAGPTDQIRNPVDGSPAEPSERIDLLPAFVDSGQALGDEETLSVALGDLDGDGDLDLVEGNFGSPSSIRPNDGGSFGSPVQQVGGGSTRAVLLVNVDGDGDLDLVVGNGGTEAAELWVNEGGVLTLRQVFGAFDTWALTAGDLDGDGDPDLVAADGAGPSVIWENVEGRFVFGEELADEDCDEPPCPLTLALVLADVDRNGELDLVEGNWDALDRLRLNEDGTFGPSTAIGFERGATTSLALGDLDLDGDPDLVTGDGLGADRVWINVEASGTFVDSGQRLGNGATSALALTDFDQDGALDLLVASPGGGNRCWSNDRSGFFRDTGQVPGAALTWSIALGDVDRDGDTDLVTGNEGGPNQVWLQSLAGTWGVADLVNPTPLGSGSEHWKVRAVDIDQDGDPDLVAAGPGASSAIWRNGGGGGFSRIQGLDPPVASLAIAAGDIDGDGDPDLIQGSQGATAGASSPDRIWINDGAGVFSTSDGLANSHSSFEVLLVDLDGDGTLDYVQTDRDGHKAIKVWTNAAGTFTDTLQPFAGNSADGTLAIAAGDVDADGFPDLVEAYDRFLGRVWRNDGAARFALLQAMPFTDAPFTLGLALGDLDLDGDPELVAASAAGSNAGCLVWSNTSGQFTSSSPALPGSFATVALADLDGDGDLDVVSGTSGTSPSQHKWFRNDRSAFVESVLVTSAGITSRGLCTDDLDGDGDVDLAIALSPGTGRLEVWFNR